MKLLSVFLFAIGLFPSAVPAQEIQIPLWLNGAPGFENRRNEPEQSKDWWIKNINNPSISVFLPPKEKATGAAVVICPGGGFKTLVYNSEGKEPAQYFNSLGIAAFVLKYRLFREDSSPYSFDKETREDAQRAMRLVRTRAKEWNFDPDRLGIVGFSAGGEVVSKVAYTSGEGNPQATDPIERVSARPAFTILIYPGPLGVPESVPADAPPIFLLVSNLDVCCSDPVVKLIQAYRTAKAPLEAHIYDKGAHGFNMGYRSTLKSIKNWPQRLTDWLEDNYYFDPARREEAKKQK